MKKMSTRSKIILAVTNGDIGTTVKQDFSVLKDNTTMEDIFENMYGKYMTPIQKAITLERMGEKNLKLSTPSVDITNKYMSIYCHSDGYVDGVGRTLVEEFNSYEKIKNLLAGGNTSCIINGVKPYHRWRGEDWDRVMPKFAETSDLSENDWGLFDYAYLFENGEWLYKAKGDAEWKKVKDNLSDDE